MRIAIPIADDRISPVFDVAQRLLVVETEGGSEQERAEVPIDQRALEARAQRVAEIGADVLICGAISRPLQWLLLSAGGEVVPQTCGHVEEVLRAFLAGQLVGDAFVMPGCCGRRRRFRGGRRKGWRS